MRSHNGTAVIHSLDRWLSVCLEQLVSDMDWKRYFDALPGIQFAFISSRSPSVLVGRIASSKDSSGRRFPFLVAGSIRTDAPLNFLVGLPIIMLPVWMKMEALMSSAQEAETLDDALSSISTTPLDPQYNVQAFAQRHADYLNQTTVGMLQSQIQQAGNPISLRHSIIALGILLAPLLNSNGQNAASKGLAFPLPEDHNQAVDAAVFWLSLLAPFLSRSNHELSLMRSRLADRPQLIVGFGGANPHTLQSIFNPSLAFEANIDLCDVEWVEDYIDGEYSIKKLSSYLEHPDLSLAQAIETFGEAFLGT